MTVKPTVSLTDHSYAMAKDLVEKGKFASVSAVLQHGLHLVQNEEETRQARLEAIRQDLEERPRGPRISAEEMREYIDTMLAEKRQNGSSEAED